MIRRRQFLIGSAGLSLITAAYGVRHIQSYPDSGLVLDNLSDREVHIYRILGRWIAPPTENIPGHGGDDITIHNIDELFEPVPEKMRLLLLGLPLAFEHGAILLDWGGPPLSSMTDEEASEYMHQWTTSTLTPQLQLLAVLKTVFGFAYYERQDVLDAIGLPGTCSRMVQTL